jgi:lipoprotein-anchoring transpeptidase ErfK/SrfK
LFLPLTFAQRLSMLAYVRSGRSLRPLALIVGVTLLMDAAAACGHDPAHTTKTLLELRSPSPAPTPPAKPRVVPPGVQIVGARELVFEIFGRPGPGAVLEHRLAATNDWAQPLWLPVTAGFSDAKGTRWLHVRLPIRPNGSGGWVRRADVRSRRVPDKIVVDLSEHTLRRYVGKELVGHDRVAVGSPGTPTPAGRFFVWAHVGYADPSGPYGVFALGLSGFSDVITDWTGGGRIAIHGTADPSDAGTDVSHGCVRVYNPQMRGLEDVPLGTPVTIRA